MSPTAPPPTPTAAAPAAARAADPSPGVALVMPMAGRGSRFAQHGRPTPKPLIEVDGAPFFWWAAESLAAAVPVRERVFVVLAEHVARFAIDRVVAERYPDATLVILPEVTAGAAETAMAGVAALRTDGPVAVNDCDHAFDAGDLAQTVRALRGDAASGGAAGALVGFRSSDPAYSYVELDGAGEVRGTVEKRVASPFAIAGCYLFADRAALTARYERYRRDCPYAELFLSGLYNELLRDGERVLFHELAAHVSFGTPEELARLAPGTLPALGARRAEVARG